MFPLASGVKSGALIGFQKSQKESLRPTRLPHFSPSLTSEPFFFFLKFIYFIYLFLAALGLRCCAQAFSSCGERGLLFVAVRRLLIAVASLVAEHGL